MTVPRTVLWPTIGTKFIAWPRERRASTSEEIGQRRLRPSGPPMTVVSPWLFRLLARRGSSWLDIMARSACECRSMKPGLTYIPVASISRRAVAPERRPMRTMRSPSMAMSARNQSSPVPSRTRPLRMMMSWSWAAAGPGAASRAVAARRPEAAAAKPDRVCRLLRTDMLSTRARSRPRVIAFTLRPSSFPRWPVPAWRRPRSRCRGRRTGRPPVRGPPRPMGTGCPRRSPCR